MLDQTISLGYPFIPLILKRKEVVVMLGVGDVAGKGGNMLQLLHSPRWGESDVSRSIL